MLLKNFRPLVSFYNGSSFKDVLGNTIAKKDYLAGQSSGDSSVAKRNGHDFEGSNLSYNYTATPNTNEFTKEKEYYKWNDICGGSPSGTVKTTAGASTRRNGMVLFVGTGDTPVTIDDYCLDSAIELSVTAASCTHTEQETTVVTRTFNNNTSDPVTIKEIGLYIFFQGYSNTGNTQYNYPVVMIGRKVLDTPVTIEVGESYTFTYTIDMSHIDFAEADNS